jgi:hypothetical protein
LAYRVDVCSQDLNAVGEVFYKLLSSCWTIVYHDGSNVDCVNKVLKVICFDFGGECVAMKCRGFTIVLVRRDILAAVLRLPRRTADRLVYVMLKDFTSNCCFRHEAYVAKGTVEEAARGMVEDFLRECCSETVATRHEGV